VNGPNLTPQKGKSSVNGGTVSGIGTVTRALSECHIQKGETSVWEESGGGSKMADKKKGGKTPSGGNTLA